MKKLPLIALLAIPLIGCGTPTDLKQHKLDLANVDLRADVLSNNAPKQHLEHVLTIDHSRLAKKEGEYLDASRVDFYANNALNTELMQENILVGLDLPLRVLSYAEDHQIKTMYTDAEFLAKRHGLSNERVLEQYDDEVEELVDHIPSAQTVPSTEVSKGFGIETIVSQYDFEDTLEQIEHDVLAEGDTVWFMNWDYKQEAAELGETLPKATLLVFGGPAPGAKAMTDFSSIGLDAFGQKVLVFEQDGEVIVAYNDIVDFAELHYGDNAIAHRVINYRLGSTLKGAVFDY
ncbi:hypothetical protein VIN01S_35070 [Vibrio inusitatus NBRC 102082]|uniref:DUF302 domain-containing protein n=1 Tax=Vibrio inusitatus NBRC 102082 TaxID=1219070 RepID=A0A4Y3HZS7_9VIBR|nr:DUF302 domain-containing protein [Vibrio inusitatus]GEA52703.1 hypothetical protein VIN01S_35070 [Vibrio inusitatus NBRC 102082]